MNKKGILWPSILILLLFIIFMTILGYLFLMPLIVVASNAIILYFLFLRIYTEITKYNRGEIYALSFAAAVFVLLLVKNFMPLWWITTAVLLTFIIAHIYLPFEKKS